MNFNIHYIATASGKYSKKTCEITRYFYHFYSLIWYQMNTKNIPAESLSSEEVMTLDKISARNRKLKIEKARTSERGQFDRETVLWEIRNVLNQTPSNNNRKDEAKRQLVWALLQQPLNAEENYAQAA